MACWLGIDVGCTGALAFHSDGKYFIFDMPVVDTGRHVGIDEATFDDLLQQFNPAVTVLEDVYGIAHQGAKSSFQFGHILGGIICTLRIFHYRYEKVLPKRWQAQLLSHYGDMDTKEASILEAAKTLGSAKLLMKPRARKPSHDRADAVNLCTYAMRTFP